ncbi:hypothetical protein MPTK1_1g09930 [Marchantia polymorpha subsp. ruderalis]|uniref:Uncharacterized protein n=2 Tax=Marchantia polymorpha TaxID=3197 RepID=A0AAF6ANG4_MARPO|nr:hypothetical protein MARPO_0096s0008 [Marchantia polymorpha]BBM97984.1 hypothetical protein Mp_1g09930 [Marchantia polymorpha subsp. ruderalis]|eukprot:PTQ32646.1 hypothetical protein MARPO_0096s0008 [Marchantia polymorpha]
MRVPSLSAHPLDPCMSAFLTLACIPAVKVWPLLLIFPSPSGIKQPHLIRHPMMSSPCLQLQQSMRQNLPSRITLGESRP